MNREKLIRAARALYAARSSGDIEVDDDAKVSDGDGGAFVQAWVWVPFDENYTDEGAPCEE